MKIVAFLFLVFSSLLTYAETVVTCRDTTRAKNIVSEFLVSDFASRRLTSSVVVVETAGTVTFSQSDIAQYQFVNNSIFVVADTPEGQPVFNLSVTRSTTRIFTGTLSQLSSTDGKLIRSIKVNCGLTLI